MKRFIAYFVSGVRTGSFFYLTLLLLGQLFPQIIYPKVSMGNILALFMMKVGTLRQFVRKTCFCRKLEIVRWMNL